MNAATPTYRACSSPSGAGAPPMTPGSARTGSAHTAAVLATAEAASPEPTSVVRIPALMSIL